MHNLELEYVPFFSFKVFAMMPEVCVLFKNKNKNIEKVTSREFLFSKIKNPSNLRFERGPPADMNPLKWVIPWSHVVGRLISK